MKGIKGMFYLFLSRVSPLSLFELLLRSFQPRTARGIFRLDIHYAKLAVIALAIGGHHP
jgi:hypothetical protein